MWVVTENLIQNVQLLDPTTEVNVEDTNFPAVNMIDEHPRKLAKATQSLVKVKATNIKWCGMLFILNVGCPNITNIRIYNDDGTIFEKDIVQLIKADNYTNYYHNILTYTDRYYVFLDSTYPDCTIEFQLNYPTTENAWIGLLTSGMPRKIGDAEWGLSDNPQDLSIIKETINGSTIIIKRTILKNKQYKIFANKAEYELFNQFIDQYRDKFWVFVPAKDIDFKESFVRYGIIKNLPQVTQNYKNAITYNIEVQEVI